MGILPTYGSKVGSGTSLRIYRELALMHCQLAGPSADPIARMIRAEDYAGLCMYEVQYRNSYVEDSSEDAIPDRDSDPMSLDFFCDRWASSPPSSHDGAICSVDSKRHIRQALAFFQKLEPLDIGIDKEGVARRAFYESEVRCLKTNQLFGLSSLGEFMFLPNVERVLSIAERKIEELLGKVPSLEQLDLTFGPGATTSVKRRNACARVKLSAAPSCSTNMLPIVGLLLAELPHYAAIHEQPLDPSVEVYKGPGAHRVDGCSVPMSGSVASVHDWIDKATFSELVEEYIKIFLPEDREEDRSWVPVEIHHGKLSFVPKNAKTYRTVMTEPTLNALVQHGYGEFISQRLLRVGQDIRDQSRNQRLAWEGSILGNVATLDLSSASDSISKELVARLLPYEWFMALSLCRTPTVEDDGKILHLHKFSSMGNGFTFPLQTLIFWALASASVQVVKSSEKRVSVYGDDIIVGTDVVPLLTSVLHCTGFSLNMTKSYWSGPFRESCGKDYLKGFDIRPIYARDWLDGEFSFLLHNFYYRNWFSEPQFAQYVLSLIDESARIYGPDGYGDGHLLGDWIPKPIHRDRGYAGFVFETYTRRKKYHTSVLPGDGVLPLYCIYERERAPITGALFPDADAVGAPVLYRLPKGDDNGPKEPYLVVPLPGAGSYRRISIYTLSN